MRIIVVNYDMDTLSPVLAWQSRVVGALAQYAEKVAVLTEHLGDCVLPENVRVEVISRPKEVGRLARYWIMNRQALRMAKEIDADAVFVHMAHRYAYLLYPAFAALRLPILLWYAHGTVSWHLRLAHWCVNRVVTSTPEGFQLPSNKLHIIGQGIDTDLFRLPEKATESTEIITVSRISRRKRLAKIIEVLKLLTTRGMPLTLKIIGSTLTEDDKVYKAELEQQISAYKLDQQVELTGFVPLHEIPLLYATTFLHLNLSETNSMDKTVMEALACGCPVLTSNPAFQTVLMDYPQMLIQAEASPEQIADQVQALYQTRMNIKPSALRELIVGKHDLQTYARRLIGHLHAIQSG